MGRVGGRQGGWLGGRQGGNTFEGTKSSCAKMRSVLTMTAPVNWCRDDESIEGRKRITVQESLMLHDKEKTFFYAAERCQERQSRSEG